PDEVDAAIDAMRGGKIDAVFIAGGNPVFTMPAAARMAEAIQKVPFVVWAGGVPDETAAMAKLLLPAHHPLEAWRDTAPRAGIRGLGQPVMQPVFDSKPVGDILLAAAARSSSTKLPWASAAEAVKAEWLALAPKADGADPEDFWVNVRREGGLFEEQHLSALSLDTSPFKAPEPAAQIVWDTWAEIHPETARKLGVAKNDVIEIKTEHGTIEAPVLVERTVRPGVIAVPLGQGHRAYGRYAKDVGANAWAILAAGATSAAATARATGKTRTLVSPLGKSDMMGRSIVEAMSIEQLARGVVPKSEAKEVTGPFEMYPPWKYPRHKWGMTIDVNACTGCSACVTACYAENNVPTVGKDGVDRGRIMSWIRIERSFPPAREAAQAPQLYLAPMLCQQCDHAPCEPV